MAEFDGVLGRLYEAALDPSELPSALEGMTRWLDGDTCHLFGLDRSNGKPVLSVSVGLDQEVGPSYANHYAEIDPRRRLALALPAGGLIACHEHFSASDVSRSEFYQDYLMPLGLHFLLGSGELTKDERMTMQIGFQRRLGRAPFDTEQCQRMKRLMPHLQRALTLMLRTDGWRMASDMGAQGLDALDCGVVSLDPDGHVTWANRHAQAVFRDGSCLREKHGRMVARSMTVQAQLEAALTSVMATGEPYSVQIPTGPAPGNDAAVMAATHAPDCCLMIVRLSEAVTNRLEDMPGITLPPRARLLAFIARSSTRRGLNTLVPFGKDRGAVGLDTAGHPSMKNSTERRRVREALSDRELQVLRLVARGYRHAEVATLLELSLNTVRTHLRNLYGKLGVHGNTEAVFEAGALGLLS